jgi:hypothetical protein
MKAIAAPGSMAQLLGFAVGRSHGRDQGDVSAPLLEPLALEPELELERLVGSPLVRVEAVVVGWAFGWALGWASEWALDLALGCLVAAAVGEEVQQSEVPVLVVREEDRRAFLDA